LGWLLVGADASGLELRALGAWLAHFDGGEYAKLVSTDGFDIHTYNAKLFGIFDGEGDIPKATRDLSKRLIYALLYGAGSKKVGSVIDPSLNEWQQGSLGKKTIETFYKNLPAIKQLKDKIDERIASKGYLVGIDGRKLQIRSRHSALNQLLQSTGAISVKKATCILYQDLQGLGLKWGEDYAFVAHVHDEIQALVRPNLVGHYKKLAIASFEKAGRYFELKCPLTGEAKSGANCIVTTACQASDQNYICTEAKTLMPKSSINESLDKFDYLELVQMHQDLEEWIEIWNNRLDDLQEEIKKRIEKNLGSGEAA
jgi:DNA polymerase I-like protein with 3'-5' exonuclease and polymerase domains